MGDCCHSLGSDRHQHARGPRDSVAQAIPSAALGIPHGSGHILDSMLTDLLNDKRSGRFQDHAIVATTCSAVSGDQDYKKRRSDIHASCAEAIAGFVGLTPDAPFDT